MLLSPPSILPIPNLLGKRQPMWSVMVLLYDDEQHLQKTLNSLLAEDLPDQEMEIEIIDARVSDAGKNIEVSVPELGLEKISYYRVDAKEGVLAGLDASINRSRGRFVHILNANDSVKPGFYREMDKLLWYYPEAGAAFCCASHFCKNGKFAYNGLPEMDAKGLLPDWLPQIAERNLIPFSSMVVKREVYENLGGFYGPVFGTAWEMWVRIARYYPVAYTPEVLVSDRDSPVFFHLQKNLSAQNLEDLGITMELIHALLPEDGPQMVLQRSRKLHAKYSIKNAHQLWSATQDKKHVKAQIKQALRMYGKGYLIYLSLIKIYFKMKFKIS